MLKNERKINYMVGLAGKGNDQHRSWTGIQINFWPLVHSSWLRLTNTCLNVENKLHHGSRNVLKFS